jgi:DNA-binding transcriptional ArsR family regulator
MPTTSAVAEIAALVGDPARTAMLAALMGGRALTARELADIAGVAPPTASGHLARLTDAGLIAMQRQGRRHYHRLASPTVAHMLESVMAVAALRDSAGADAQRARRVRGPREESERRLRTCYDHLAGRIAVAIADRLVEQGAIEFSADGGAVTSKGVAVLSELGVDLDAAGRAARRGRIFCRPCLDWSERRPHIAGAVGAALCQTCLAKGWTRSLGGGRALTLTPAGETALRRAFELRLEG